MNETNPDQKDAPGCSAEERPPDRAGFLGFVAHEMRNPLSTAMWSAELLVRLSSEERGGARGEKLSGMCLRTLTRLRVLLEDFFLVERLAIRGLPLKREEVALAPALERAQEKSGVEIVLPPLPDVSVPADRGLLERALEALMAVAGRDSPVAFDFVLADGRAELRFSGGPPPADALAVPTKATPSDPTGRALSVLVARAIAEAHGGHVRIDGPSYVLALPLEDRTRESQP